MVLIFVVVVSVGIILAWRLLAPEMYVTINNVPKYSFPWEKVHALRRSTKVQVMPVTPADYPLPVSKAAAATDDGPGDEVQRLERLLLEKNRTIDRLQKALEAERSHRTQFMKVKGIMDDEIGRLKTQVKTLKPKKEQHHA